MNTLQESNRPIDQSYKVDETLYAGEYPGDKDCANAASKIEKLLDFGIRHFIDLTEECELNPYEHLLSEGTTYLRFPIKDCGVPNNMDSVKDLLARIDEKQKQGGLVYVHCWGGVGRTGTIVACYLARKMSAPTLHSVSKVLQSRFQTMPKASHRRTPETSGQIKFIARFIESISKGNDHKREEPSSASKTTKLTRMKTFQDKIRGSLVGGAAGDALGYPVEFRTDINEIRWEYGDKGITRYKLVAGVAQVSDDTQMSLYTANGLMNAVEDARTRGFAYWPARYIQKAYIEWYYTQTKLFGCIKSPTCWISNIPELYANRGPGNTCMSALRNLSFNKRVANDSKGNGGIMRTAPIAHLAASQGFDIMYATQLACDCSRMTHLHPMGYLPSGLMTFVLYRILKDNDVTAEKLMQWVDEGVSALENMHNDDGKGCYITMFQREIYELRDMSHLAAEMAASGCDDLEAINKFNGGWTGETAWYISFFCTLRHIGSFEDAIVAAVNHSGDSDSTGAICGNLMGAIHGYEAIPEHFKQNLELHDVILRMADDLYAGKISEQLTDFLAQYEE